MTRRKVDTDSTEVIVKGWKCMSNRSHCNLSAKATLQSQTFSSIPSLEDFNQCFIANCLDFCTAALWWSQSVIACLPSACAE